MPNISVPRVWPDSTVAILASGPSLTVDDVAYCRGKVRVMTVNDAYRLAPWADVFYSSDRQWWVKHRGEMSPDGLKYGIGSRRTSAAPLNGCPEIQILENTGREGLELAPTGLRTIQNSGGAAINLAVHLGARRIVLLGYNMGIVRGRRHFFGDRVGANQSSAYRAYVDWFATMVEPLKSIGVEVVNCTIETHLHCFPERPLRDVLPVTAEVAA